MFNNYKKLIKRIIDFVSSLVGLVLLFPVFLIISIMIKLTSNGPILFKQVRIGRYSKKFIIIKFRTMVKNTENDGTGSITIAGDYRITTIGKFLRKWKLDELPSLWNVLKGDMSLVGPRPDVPGYTDKLEGNDRRILELYPGITGPATLKYSNEEKILMNVDGLVKYNDEVIFLDKVKINLEYLDNWSFWLDIKIILKTIFRIPK